MGIWKIFRLCYTYVSLWIYRQSITSPKRTGARWPGRCVTTQALLRSSVALPDKQTAYNTYKLWMKALKDALAKSSQYSDASEESSLLADRSEDTPETSSDDEEPVLQDESESCSSLSSEELVNMAEKRQRKSEKFQKQEVSSEDDSGRVVEASSFPSPTKKRSKKRLHFSLTTKSSPRKPVRSDVVIISPSKCFVSVQRMKASIEVYYINKRQAKMKVAYQREGAAGLHKETPHSRVGEGVRADSIPPSLVPETPVKDQVILLNSWFHALLLRLQSHLSSRSGSVHNRNPATGDDPRRGGHSRKSY